MLWTIISPYLIKQFVSYNATERMMYMCYSISYIKICFKKIYQKIVCVREHLHILNSSKKRTKKYRGCWKLSKAEWATSIAASRRYHFSCTLVRRKEMKSSKIVASTSQSQGIIMMSSSWNFPSLTKPSWSTSIFELKLSCQFFFDR